MEKKPLTVAVKHNLVQLVWQGIDWLDTRRARSAVLPSRLETREDILLQWRGNQKVSVDVYWPQLVTNQLPVIIYFHGGGFLAGDKSHTRQYCMTLATEGYTVFNVNYPLAPKHIFPAQINSVLASIGWISEHCHQYHGDGHRIVFAGESAGAFLAGLAGCICTNPKLSAGLGVKAPIGSDRIMAMLLFSGIYDLQTGATRSFPSIRSDIELLLGTHKIKEYPNISALSVTNNVTQKFPPTFVTSGAVDGLYPETSELILVLSRQGIKHYPLLFPKTEKQGRHGFHRILELRTAKRCLAEIPAFLRALQ